MAAGHPRVSPRPSEGARSPFGWWVASYLERLEWSDEDRGNPRRLCLAWENTVLLQASNREQAYTKAMALGRLSNTVTAHNGRGRTGKWRFEGLTSLLPIYDELKDGAEIVWVAHENRTVARVKRMVKKKKELECFDGLPQKRGRGKAKS